MDQLADSKQRMAEVNWEPDPRRGLGALTGRRQARLASLEKEEERNKKARESWKQLVRELEIKEHELKLLEEQVVGSNAPRVS